MRIQNNAIPQNLVDRVRDLRISGADAEALLWQLLRDRTMDGRKFTRHHAMSPYVLDFYCHDAGLAVELDHGDADIHRKMALARRGVRVLRFVDREVLDDTEAVVASIWKALRGGESRR
ncbi:MAG: DUF559 domain-containing protein [Chromatiales bacterium]|nr:DUF559 domain-containing protein [Chromatiales bacterium]